MSDQDVLNERRIASMWNQVDLESGQTPLFATLKKKDYKWNNKRKGGR